jgi:predicted amidohydrolase
LFANLIRVPPESWDWCDVHSLGEAVAIDAHEWRSGIVVTCVPVIADPDELSWQIRRTDGRRYYRIQPAGSEVTQRRIVEIVTNLDRSGALIAVAPELTLSPAILDRWKDVLRARDHRGSRLRWVLVGTGNLSSGRRPSNTAVLLDARTGAEIARQEKHYPFNLGSEELARWKLTSRLGADPIAEDLSPGRRLTVLDAGPLRVAMPICEDLERTMDIGRVIRDMGISLLLTPVFSRPLKLDRWEHKAAATHLRETGATVVVSNSMVVGSLTGSADGTALVVPSHERALIQRSTGPADPVWFRIEADGSATAC